jgi:hypothetical protein
VKPAARAAITTSLNGCVSGSHVLNRKDMVPEKMPRCKGRVTMVIEGKIWG